jgi:type IV secretory pathway protease TraF
VARALWGTVLTLALLIASILAKRHPLILWNQSSSVPIGLYWIEQVPPRSGDLAVVHLPDHTADLAARRGYLPLSAYLLKPVAATGGDRICRLGGNVLLAVPLWHEPWMQIAEGAPCRSGKAAVSCGRASSSS